MKILFCLIGAAALGTLAALLKLSSAELLLLVTGISFIAQGMT